MAWVSEKAPDLLSLFAPVSEPEEKSAAWMPEPESVQ